MTNKLPPRRRNILFRHRLVCRQALITLTVAFLLGLIMSFIQIGTDIVKEKKQIESTAWQVVNMLRESAVQAVYLIDEASATAVARGLLEYHPVCVAQVIDEFGAVLASETRPKADGRLKWLSEKIFGRGKVYSVPLLYGDEKQQLGFIKVTIDNYRITSNFFSRLKVVFLSDFVRNILLASVLMFIFFFSIIRPLLTIVDRVLSVDPASPAEKLLHYPEKHERDELALLVEAVNHLLKGFDRSLTRRYAAENELQQHQAHLEQVVNERTSELHEMIVALEESKKNAEAANQTKSSFLANMSHELRTPLNAIIGFSQLIRHDKNLPPGQQENMDIIYRSGNHLLDLINEVLDMSKIEVGKVCLNEKNFDLQSMYRDLEDLLRFRADRKNLFLYFTPLPDVPKYIRADEIKLRQVLINLIGNAIKFTEKGKVVVRAEINEIYEASEAFFLRFVIEDTGPGIAREDMAALFEPFVQTKLGRNFQEGSGLGLAISRKFVQLMGGDVEVHSRMDEGTVFAFNIRAFPADASEAERASRPGRVTAVAAGQPQHKILIVDDSIAIRKLLVQMLSPYGFDLREAEDGKKTVEIWQEWQPDLIWMDILMPVMDGYEAVKTIKYLAGRTPEKKLPVIIALTASSYEEEGEKILQAGCDDFLRKPFKEADIFKLLERHLGIRFIYEDEETKNETLSVPGHKSAAIIPEDFSDIPDEILIRLKQAAAVMDMNEVNGIIEEIKLKNKDTAGRLAILAEDFEYEIIAESIDIIFQTKRD